MPASRRRVPRPTAGKSKSLKVISISNGPLLRLVVEERTVVTYVSRILMKLALRDRVQAVVVAYESGFVRPDA